MTVRYPFAPAGLLRPPIVFFFFSDAFRALVEENVKSNVQKIANSSVIYDVNDFIINQNWGTNYVFI